MSTRKVIAIDGLAGSGKSTLARLLADKLGYVYLSTGLLYRAAGFIARNEKIDLKDGDAIAAAVLRHNIALVLDKDRASHVLIDGIDHGQALHDPNASEAASKSAQHGAVRQALMAAQRNAFLGENLVAEGRDIGTVVFPDADCKFFVEVAPQVRIERRLRQLYPDAQTFDANRLELLKKELRIEITERDERDQERAVAPTKAAADAILIDNSGLTLTAVLEKMYSSCASLGLSGRRK
jgi:cytidylate kinase